MHNEICDHRDAIVRNRISDGLFSLHIRINLRAADLKLCVTSAVWSSRMEPDGKCKEGQSRSVG